MANCSHEVPFLNYFIWIDRAMARFDIELPTLKLSTLSNRCELTAYSIGCVVRYLIVCHRLPWTLHLIFIVWRIQTCLFRWLSYVCLFTAKTLIIFNLPLLIRLKRWNFNQIIKFADTRKNIFLTLILNDENGQQNILKKEELTYNSVDWYEDIIITFACFCIIRLLNQIINTDNHKAICRM